MIRQFTAALGATVLLAGLAAAQQPLPPPIPLYPGAAPRSIEPDGPTACRTSVSVYFQ